jgi:predicted NAD/FAD-binding protein
VAKPDDADYAPPSPARHGDAVSVTSASSVAVIGSGVSGLTAAYLLSRNAAVTLYEADGRFGGHAHTHQLTDGRNRVWAVDTGFIVHNDRTYPLLRRLFAELGVATRPTEMSMSIRDDASGLEYAGGRGATGVFAQRRRLVDARFWALLIQVNKFHRHASTLLEQSDDTDQTTLGEFLEHHRFSRDFVDRYVVPVVSCVWSMGTGAALDYPARYLFRFLANHGMLSVGGSPQWYTVTGGSDTYVQAIVARLGQARHSCAVVGVRRHPDGVEVTDIGGQVCRFDKVVIATHPDQALSLLSDATPQEREVLGAFRYSTAETVLHRDTSLLPRARPARSSWNYLVPNDTTLDVPPIVTYWMNRLQGLDDAEPYLVTLNAADRIDPRCVIEVMRYQHPIYDRGAIAAQRRLTTLNTATTAFAGAYHGWGFHEDGCRSGVEAARALGVAW